MHQAPDAYATIVHIVSSAKESQRIAFQAQTYVSKNLNETMIDALRSNVSRDEKNDAYNCMERMNLQATYSIERQNFNNNNTAVKIVAVTTVAATFGILLALISNRK